MTGRRRDRSHRRLPGLALVLLLALAIGSAFVPEAFAFLRATPRDALAPAAGPAPVRPAAPSHQARQIIDRNDFYDPTNPDYERLQRSEEATRNLPHDAVGFPDWMRALREGRIDPRSDISGPGRMDVLDLDVIMRNTRDMPHVRFPHRAHTQWLACSNCHPDPFQPVAGRATIRMADIFRGQYCGRCHDRVAFITFFSCHRCHSVPQSPGPRD